MPSALHFSLVFAAWVLLLPSATARDIYVSNTAGDDSFTGRHPQNVSGRGGPLRTIGRALKLAGPSDRIVLDKTGQPYRESISLVGSRHSGYSAAPFTIEGNGAILDGSAPVPPKAWEHYHANVYRFRPRLLDHQQLFLNDQPASRVAADRTAKEPPELEPLQWCLYRNHVYFRTEPLKRPEDYPLTCANLRVGITLFHVDRVDALDLTVQGFQLDGINAFNNARRVSLGRVTCRGNGRAGISVGGASLVSIEASLVGNNGRAQLLTHPWSETHLRQSELLSNTAPAWLDQGGHVYIDGKQVEGGFDELTLEQP